MTNFERRIASVHGLRAFSETAFRGKKITGYAARFNSLSGDLGGFREKIAPKAFSQFLSSDKDVVALLNHDPNFVLGRRSAHTLVLKEDDRGLAFDIDLPSTSYANDLHESVSRGDIAGASFAFALSQGDDEWSDEEDEERGGRYMCRTIKNFSNLMDVSPVTYPAYEATSLEARSMVEIPCTVSLEMRSRIIRSRIMFSTTERAKLRRRQLLNIILG